MIYQLCLCGFIALGVDWFGLIAFTPWFVTQREKLNKRISEP